MSTATASKTKSKTADKPKAEPKEKEYVFGGSLEHPELGANSRRLWLWITENLTKKDQAQLRKEVLAAQAALPADRFIRWYTICAVAEKLGITGPEGMAINQALVRRLQSEDKDGKVGRNAKIKLAA